MICHERSNRPIAPSFASVCGGSSASARAGRRDDCAAFWREERPDVAQLYFLDAAYFGAPRQDVRRKDGRAGPEQPRLLAHAAASALDRLVRPFVDATLTNTEAGRETLVDRERHRADRVVVLENGVDTAKFNRFLYPDTSKSACALAASRTYER